MQGDVTWRLTAYPLTPIHIGDGSLLAAEAWRLSNDGWLERFEPAAVLRAADPVRRKQILDALDRGDLTNAQRLLREAVRPDQVLERIQVGAAAAEQLRPVVDNPLRRGDVRPFVRTGARPYLPGSSLKGALRTAFLSSLVAERTKPAIEAKKRERRKLNGAIESRASKEVEALLLEHENPDQDPFRFVEVADILLPADSTRVEQVVNWRPPRLIKDGRQPAEKMQMIFEVSESLATGRPLALPCTIGIEAGRLAAVRRLAPSPRTAPDTQGRTPRGKVPRLSMTAEALAAAVNAFHWQLWDYELDRFYRDEPSIERALRSLIRVKAPDGRELGPPELRARTDVLLLRLGRFGQFESKSLAGVRKGWNAQAKPPYSMAEGNTRNLVKMGGTSPLLPLGWLLLLPEGFEPVLAPSSVAAASAPSAAASRADDRAGRRKQAFYQGEPVEVRKREQGEVLIAFEGGDTEWVGEDELEWR